MRVLALSVVLFLLTGCGAPNGDTWLIRTVEDEITVSQAGAAWNSLPLQTQQAFMSGDNPVGDFITSLGRKAIIVAEVSNDEYLHSPLIESMKDSWLRSSTFPAYRDSLITDFRQSITDQDLSNYRELMGKVVWYRNPAGEQMGASRLPDLPWNIAFAFDTMAAGQTVEISGETYTLDSVAISPDSLIQVTLADTARVNSFARSTLTESRVSAALESLRISSRETLFIDTLLVENYALSSSGVASESILADWEGGELTAGEFTGTISYLSMGQQVAPSSVPWLLHNLKNQVFLSEVQNHYSELYPEDYAELLSGAESFAMEKASDLLFEHRIASHVQITDSMVFEAYQSLDSIPVVPETRTFQSIVFSAGVLEEVIALMAEGADPLDLGYPGYAPFLTEGSEYLSRPVLPSELPTGLGSILFMLDEDSTAWQRPLIISENLVAVIRLDSIIPPHEAAYGEIENSLRMNLRAHLEEQQTVEWLCELESRHSLEINSDILGDLPADPSAWSEL